MLRFRPLAPHFNVSPLTPHLSLVYTVSTSYQHVAYSCNFRSTVSADSAFLDTPSYCNALWHNEMSFGTDNAVVMGCGGGRSLVRTSVRKDAP